MNSTAETTIFIELLQLKTGVSIEQATSEFIKSGYNYPKALERIKQNKDNERLMGLYMIHCQEFKDNIDFETFKRTL